jgi:nucleoside-diphosphate-sugar epimerase
MSLRHHKIWIIGAGFLGSVLAEACRAEGARVLTIDPAAVANLRGSAADKDLLRHALTRLEPDIVFCCAATRGGTPEDYRKAYLAPVVNLDQLLRGTRVVFCSSTSVYAGRDGVTVTEESPVLAESERAEILLHAEQVVLRNGGVVARLAPLYGPERCELVRRFKEGLPGLPGREERVLNYLHVEDAADALLLLGTHPWLQDGIYNVSGECFSKGDIYARLAELTGLDPVPEESEPSVRGASDMRVDCSRIRELGWEPICTMEELAQEWKR